MLSQISNINKTLIKQVVRQLGEFFDCITSWENFLIVLPANSALYSVSYLADFLPLSASFVHPPDALYIFFLALFSSWLDLPLNFPFVSSLEEAQ